MSLVCTTYEIPVYSEVCVYEDPEDDEPAYCYQTLEYYETITDCYDDGSGGPTGNDCYDYGINCDGEDPIGGGGDGGNPEIDPTTLLDAIMSNTSTLNQAQKEAIEQLLNKIGLSCIGNSLYDYMTSNNKQFKFQINSAMNAQAAYNPVDNSISMKNPSTADIQSLFEELFHAYQNFTIYGGTSQYLISGRANIEFEAKVIRDVYQLVEGIAGSLAVTDDDYTNWLSKMTDGFTKFPSSYSSISSEYFNFMNLFIQQNPGYEQAPIDPNLNPSSMFSLVNSSDCPK